MVGRPRPGRFMVYGEHHFRSAWIGWSWIALFSLGTIVGIAGQVMWRRPDSGYEPLAFFSGVFLVPALLITFNATRPVLVVGKRGVTVRELPGRGQLIPWRDIGEVTLVQNSGYRVVVNAYAGSVTTVCSIDRHRAERKFASLARRIGEFVEWARTSPSAVGQLDSGARGCLTGEPIQCPGHAGGRPPNDRAARRAASAIRYGSGASLRGAISSLSGWVPDPTGRHELRFIRNRQWTALVMNGGSPASDDSITGPAEFDWAGPDVAPAKPGANPEWLPTGAYVFRSRWRRDSLRARPVWYSAVWAFGRTAFVIDSDSHAFTQVDTGTKYLWRRHFSTGADISTGHHAVLGTVPGPVGRRFRDAGGNVLATRKSHLVISPAGEPLASIYGVANQRPDEASGDDTFVISVLQPIAAPLGLLILTYGLCKRPHFAAPKVEGGG
jgi:hypothetical protein